MSRGDGRRPEGIGMGGMEAGSAKPLLPIAPAPQRLLVSFPRGKETRPAGRNLFALYENTEQKRRGRGKPPPYKTA